MFLLEHRRKGGGLMESAARRTVSVLSPVFKSAYGIFMKLFWKGQAVSNGPAWWFTVCRLTAEMESWGCEAQRVQARTHTLHLYTVAYISMKSKKKRDRRAKPLGELTWTHTVRSEQVRVAQLCHISYVVKCLPLENHWSTLTFLMQKGVMVESNLADVSSRTVTAVLTLILKPCWRDGNAFLWKIWPRSVFDDDDDGNELHLTPILRSLFN